MERRFDIGSAIEVAGVVPEEYVRQKKRLSGNGFSKLFVVGWQQEKPADNKRCESHDSQRGKYPSNSSFPKLQKIQSGCLRFFEEQRRNQISGNHKEYVDANKSSWRAKLGVIQEHWNNSKCT
ncbi:MAG TPA: hypothetical protein VKH45_11735 [Candidatus Acidoferrum sp.]|nr:hypothetical protein [Candidatus Acidoferrum sp.]